jgi:hypothetical protein
MLARRRRDMTEHPSDTRSWFRSRSGVVLLVFLAMAAFFLVTEHRAHVLGALPYVLLLACPLLHLFHSGHGRGHGHRGGDDRGRREGKTR